MNSILSMRRLQMEISIIALYNGFSRVTSISNATILYNPTAGRFLARAFIKRVVPILSDGDWNVSFLEASWRDYEVRCNLIARQLR